MSDTPILLDNNGQGTATITLNRPGVHNAFDDDLIQQLTDTIIQVGADAGIRALVLTGAGPSFSAGADLNWMKRMAQASEQQNRDDSLRLAALMRKLAFCPKTTVARINGPAFGGGVGLAACCDIAVTVDSARFGLTEARLGLVPAVISPYVIAAIGARHASRLFQTAQVFSASRALELGLVHRSVPADELDQAVFDEISRVLECGPQATRAAKSLVAAVSGRTEDNQERLDQATANLIASLRVSPEGQEGIQAFLEKRAAAWRQEN